MTDKVLEPGSEPACEICGRPATVVIVGDELVSRTRYAFCKAHAGSDHEGYIEVTSMNGRRSWLQVSEPVFTYDCDKHPFTEYDFEREENR